MTTLHTFGCSITQGFALPDIVKPLVDPNGQPLTVEQIRQLGPSFHWEDIHLYQPSQYAWPQVLGHALGHTVINHARRGACFQQIARQCAVARPAIKPNDLVIVMWTYLSRLSLQWPAKTSVPFCNIVDADLNWRTKILPGFNKFFGLSRSNVYTQDKDAIIHSYIHHAASTHLDPMGTYDRYHNNLVLQVMTDGFLRSTGARVIHLSVEPDAYLDQLEQARSALVPALREPYTIPDPATWYAISVDHHSCRVIHDPSIPPAENDMHPSVEHHRRFAQHVYEQYFHDL